uniref:putative glycolipid-binding domain-containing protein n=1 Tax=Brachybacterium sp. GPGPB12 TaxID=3023517 RepID=UPI004048F09B
MPDHGRASRCGDRERDRDGPGCLLLLTARHCGLGVHRPRARADGRELVVRRTEAGWQVDGEARPDLDAAREVDISVSPLSNTLPIRRLGLAIGESADIVTAYVRVPELDVTTDPQRYTRTGEHEYLYESRDSDFHRYVTVDEEGLVLEYPGLFTREEG